MEKNIRKSLLWLFYLLTVLATCWITDTRENANTCSRVLPVAAFLDQGNFILDNYRNKTMDISEVNGHYYTDKAPLPSLLVLPFALLASKAGVLKPHDGSYYGPGLYILGDILCGVIPFLYLCWVISVLLKKRPHLIPVSIAGLTGSMVFVFAGSFFAHVLSAALLVASWRSGQQNIPYLSGFYIGLACLTEFTLIWVAVIRLFQQFGKKNTLWFYASGIAPSFAFILLYNFYFTGNPFDMLYNHVGEEFHSTEKHLLGFTYPKVTALFGLLFSLNRGIIFYWPVLIYAAGIILKRASGYGPKQNLKRLTEHPVLLPCVIIMLFISAHGMWDGGFSYGPRHLISISVLFYVHAVSSANNGMAPLWLFILVFSGVMAAALARITVIYSVPLFDGPLWMYLSEEFVYRRFHEEYFLSFFYDISLNGLRNAFLIIMALMQVLSVWYYKASKA